MTQHDVEQFVEALPGVEREDNMGYVFYFVGDYHMVPFATIGTKDNEYDNVSQLDRDDVFRLNLGVSKASYDALFAGLDAAQSIDYSVLDTFLPHPHYASQFYVCILNPSEEKTEKVKELIIESHALAEKKQELRNKGKAE